MKTFHARATRNEGWWSIRVDEEPAIITQARRLEQIPEMVRDALELFPELTSTPSEDIINVTIEVDELSEAQAAKDLNAQAKKLA